MINYFITEDGKVTKTDGITSGCWIDVVEPTSEERAWLRDELGIAEEFVRSAFDDEETAHADLDEDTGQALIIIDCPFVEDEDESVDKSIVQYDTHPLSFVFVPEQDYFITLSFSVSHKDILPGHVIRDVFSVCRFPTSVFSSRCWPYFHHTAC